MTLGSGTGISAAFPPAIQAEARTLEQDVAQIGVTHRSLEANTVKLAEQVFQAHTRFMMSGGTGFFSWFEFHSGIPRGSAHRYLDIHRAAKSGFVDTQVSTPDEGQDGEVQAPAAPRTATDLARIGRALREGVPAAQLKSNPEAAAKLTEARLNKGLLEKRVTPDTDAALGTALNVLREEWQQTRPDPTPPEPELLSLLARWLQEVSGTPQFRRMMTDLINADAPTAPTTTPDSEDDAQARQEADIRVARDEEWTCAHCGAAYEQQGISKKTELPGGNAYHLCTCEDCGGLYGVYEARA